DRISVLWYEGIGQEAGTERWAFAFSAKEKWRSKVDSDVKGIVGTERDYKLIYFMTNQFVRDKVRAKAEADLKKKYGIQVRILDRTWIVKCIFEHKRFELAIETLKIEGYESRQSHRRGPLDTKRELELQELEDQIQEPERYSGVPYQLAEDCLRAA